MLEKLDRFSAGFVSPDCDENDEKHNCEKDDGPDYTAYDDRRLGI